MSKNMTGALISCLLLLYSAASLGFSDASSKQLQLVGEARFKFLFWDIYDSKLFTASGAFNSQLPLTQQLPLKLKIDYLRDIEAADLVDNTIDQWRKIGLSQSAIDAHQALISDLWPNIGKNDQLAIVLDEQGSQFYYNGEAIGGQLSTEFGVDFVSIWLAENTTEPKLRNKLINAQSD